MSNPSLTKEQLEELEKLGDYRKDLRDFQQTHMCDYAGIIQELETRLVSALEKAEFWEKKYLALRSSTPLNFHHFF